MRYGGVAKKTHNIVYISYNGTDNPLLRSQVIPYLKALSRDDRRFFFISLKKTAPKRPCAANSRVTKYDGTR